MGFQQKGRQQPRGEYKAKEKKPQLYDEAKRVVEAVLDKRTIGAFSKRKRGTVRWDVEKQAVLRAVCKEERIAEAAIANPESVKEAMLTAAGLGITLHHTLGYAYLVPETFADRPGVGLVVGYKGLEQLALKSGTVKNIQTDLIYSNDTFRRGMNRDGTSWVEHEPSRGDRGVLEGAFCRAILANGTNYVEFMDVDEINACESAADAKQGGYAKAWKGPFRKEFQKKSVVRRAAKHWILEGEFAEHLKKLDELEPMDFDAVNTNKRAPAPVEPEVTTLTDAHKQAIIQQLGNEFDMPADQSAGWIERQCEAWGHPAGSKTYADANWEKVRDALVARATKMKQAKDTQS